MTLSELRKTEHLSASSIGTYVECSLMYKFSKIDKIPMEQKSDAMEFGTCIHITLEQFYQERLIGEKLLLKDVHEIFEKTWKIRAEDKTDIQKELATLYNFDCYQMTLSTKFESKYPLAYPNDELEPSGDLIPSGYRFERIDSLLTDKFRFSETIKEIYKEKIKNTDDPKLCTIGNKGLFLNSHGEFYPCCWVANRYEHNNKWIEMGKTKFNLHNRTFEEIINDEFWSNEFLKFDNLECKTKCNKCALQDENYLLNW